MSEMKLTIVFVIFFIGACRAVPLHRRRQITESGQTETEPAQVPREQTGGIVLRDVDMGGTGEVNKGE